MSEVKVNKISPRTNCGTVQLGDSGDTITIPAGATITNNGTQTGFGRTGTVDWDTTAKTAGFTAVSGTGYFVNTTSGAITVTLPATPSAGDIVSIADYAGTALTNNVTIARNGSNINGAASDLTISKNNSAVTLVYVDGTQGWKGTVTSNLNDIETQPEYIVATGGTITCCGDYKIHTFTGPGTFTVCSVGNPAGSNTVSYLVVAGGAGGGSSSNGNGNAKGGGGAGGYRESKASTDCYSASPLNATCGPTYDLAVCAQAYPITVGAGGAEQAQAPSPLAGNQGSNSVFSTITSAGGGAGAGGGGGCSGTGSSGGSGGGPSSGPPASGGTGNTPPVSPPQGQNGEAMSRGCATAGGGGGGAGEVGGTNGNAAGGDGVTTSISGSATGYAGGGGGGRHACYSPWYSCRSLGGGGRGQIQNSNSPDAVGLANTGGGGGGGGSPCGTPGAAGGSGIVIIRYKYQ
jgi:hypothetical protein